MWVKTCSVTDNALLNKENKFMRMGKEVLDSDLDLSTGVYLYIKVPQVNRDNLLCLIHLCESAERYFHRIGLEVGVSSLSTTIDYVTENLDTFVSRDRLNAEPFDDWYKKVSARKEVKGKLMGRLEGEYDYFIVSLLPPEGYSENEMYRHIKRWLENREVRAYELYLNPEIRINPAIFTVEIDGKAKPVVMDINFIGWSTGRVLVNTVSNNETIKRIIPAVAFISFTILLLKLGSFRQAFTGLLVVILGVFFTRGTIGIIDRLFSIFCREEVFTVLVYTVCLIPGFSFSMRRFEEFNDSDRNKGFWEKWQDADKAGVSSTNLIVFTSIADFLIFMSLANRLGPRSMFQIGILSAIVLFYAWLLSKYFLPAFHRAIGGEKRNSNENTNAISRLFCRGVEKVNNRIGGMSASICRLVRHKKASIASVSVLVIIIVVTVLFVRKGYLRVESDPSEFLKNTMLGDISQEMKKKGRPGFNPHEIYIEPKNDKDINDPEFINQLWEYSQVVSGKSQRLFSVFDTFLTILAHDYPDAYRTGNPPMGAILRIARNNALKNIGRTAVTPDKIKHAIRNEAREIISGIWNDIRDNSDRAVIKHFLARNALLIIATDEGYTSNDVAKFRDFLLQSADNYGYLAVKMPGKIDLYPEVDSSISKSGMLNSILSQVMVAALCGVWIAWRNRVRNVAWKLCPFRTGCFMAAPFILSTCAIFLVMMALNIPLDIATSSIGSISVSVAVDLPIFFMGALQPLILSGLSFEDAMKSRKMADETGKILSDFAINTPAFLPLVFSLFPIIFNIGYLMVLVMVMCTIGTMLIMAPMMRWSVIKCELQ